MVRDFLLGRAAHGNEALALPYVAGAFYWAVMQEAGPKASLHCSVLSCLNQLRRVVRSMKTLQDYLQRAEKCRQLAANARSPEERQRILTMAATWAELAERRRRFLERGAKNTDRAAT